MKGIGGHESHRMGKDEWLTPPEIIRACGIFYLDPCAPVNRPWDTASVHYTVEDDGLSQSWKGRVWLNPPYGRMTGIWLEKLANHGFGTALIFARTETKMFFEQVWNRATALFFFRGRIRFYHVDGTQTGNAGAPSVLVAYGESDQYALKCAAKKLDGQFIDLTKQLL